MPKKKSKKIKIGDYVKLDIIGLNDSMYRIKEIKDNQYLCVSKEVGAFTNYEHKIWVVKEQIRKDI